MNKIYSFAAALVAAMVILVSCMSENDKTAMGISEAMQANDAAKVAELVNTLKGANDLTADQAAVILGAHIWQAGTATDEAVKAQAQADILSFYETATQISGIEKSFEAAKANGLDIPATVELLKANIAAAEAAAAAEAEAAAAEADAEADGEEADAAAEAETSEE